MITITRQQVRAVRQVFRQALCTSARSRTPGITLAADSQGLSIRCAGYDAAVERRIAGEFPAESLLLPFQALSDCDGRDDRPVTFRLADGQIFVEWSEAGIPQTRCYDVLSEGELNRSPEFPPSLRRMQSMDRQLLTALAAAAETTDPYSTRYALGCLCLRGEDGQIAATDGRQILAQHGFEFPWKGELLVPASKAFSSREIADCQTVALGKTKEWLALHCDDWTLLFKINEEGRFPRLEDFVRPCEAESTLHFSDADAEFFGTTAKKLPGDDECESPLTVELNGAVAVRAKGEQQAEPTELVLSTSRCAGKPICFQTNRRFLTRAVKLGFREVQLRDAMSPAYCRDGRRVFVWALLEPQGAIQPSEHMTRIVSPAAEDKASRPSIPSPPQQSMPRTKQHTNGQAMTGDATVASAPGPGQAASPTTAEETNGASLPELAEALKSSLDTAQSQVRDLIAGLKKQRKQQRLVASTLQSLRELEELAV